MILKTNLSNGREDGGTVGILLADPEGFSEKVRKSVEEYEAKKEKGVPDRGNSKMGLDMVCMRNRKNASVARI